MHKNLPVYGYEHQHFVMPPMLPEGVEEAPERSPWVNPDGLSAEDRRGLVEGLQSGELDSVRFSAVVFGDEPNLNRTRPEPGRLGEFVEAINARKSTQVIDHSSSVSEAVGTIHGARVVEDARGVKQLVLDVELTNLDAAVRFVRGELREHSISYHAAELACSECGEEAWEFLCFRDFSCDCDPKKAELFGTGPIEFLHNSFVVQGAYRRTGTVDHGADTITNLASSGGCTVMLGARSRFEQELFSMLKKKQATAEPALSVDDSPEAVEETPEEASEPASKATPTGELSALERNLLAARFELAVRDRKITPAERPRVEALAARAGLEFALEDLAARVPRPDLPVEALGVEAREDESPEVVNRWATAESAVKLGVISKDTLERAKRGELVLPF